VARHLEGIGLDQEGVARDGGAGDEAAARHGVGNVERREET
jgi:hypothetical protein